MILGIDPGQRTGLSIFHYGKEIEISFYPSTEKLVFHVIQILWGLRVKRKIVKIGDGYQHSIPPINNRLKKIKNFIFFKILYFHSSF